MMRVHFNIRFEVMLNMLRNFALWLYSRKAMTYIVSWDTLKLGFRPFYDIRTPLENPEDHQDPDNSSSNKPELLLYLEL